MSQNKPVGKTIDVRSEKGRNKTNRQLLLGRWAQDKDNNHEKNLILNDLLLSVYDKVRA